MRQKFKGVVENISEPINLKRDRAGGQDIKKVTISLADQHGQRVHADLINNRIKLIQKSGMVKYSIVEITFSFKGTYSPSGMHNNIFVHELRLLQK